MTADSLPPSPASHSAAVADLPAYRRRRAHARLQGRRNDCPVDAAVLDAELRGDAKLLVVCWLALQSASSPGAATLLDAVILATGLRGHEALLWVAQAIVDDAQRSSGPALSRYIDADWPRMHAWAARHVAKAGAVGDAGDEVTRGAAAVSIHGFP